MKKIFLIVWVLFPLTTIGQNENTAGKRNLSVGLSFSPDYAYRKIPEGTFTADLRNEREFPIFGFTTGISLTYKLNKRLLFESGLQFSKKGEQSKVLELVYTPIDPDNSIELPITVRDENFYYYLDIPIKINYLILNKRLNLFISAGFSTNIFLNHKSIFYFEYGDGTSETISGSWNDKLYRINVAALGGIGVGYALNERLNIRIEPIFRHSIIPIFNAPLNQYLYSFGANVGILYAL